MYLSQGLFPNFNRKSCSCLNIHQHIHLLSQEAPDKDNYSDTGSGTHYDDEDSDYNDDGGSGDVDSWDDSDDDGYYEGGNYKDTSAGQPPTNSLDNSESPRNVRPTSILRTVLVRK